MKLKTVWALKPSLFTAFCALLAWPLAAQVSITSGGTYTENFDTLGASGTWTDNGNLLGWYAALTNVPTGEVTPFTSFSATSGGGTTSSTLYSMGTSSSATDRALGGIPSAGAGRVMLGWRLKNDGSSVITNLVLTYDGEEWRQATPNTSYVDVYYQIFDADAGALTVLSGWNAAPAGLTFYPPTTGTAGAIDGNNATNRVPWLTASIPGISLSPGKEIWFKWSFVKPGGGSFMMGVDNVRLAVDLGAPPTISAIPNITVMSTQTSPNSPFTVGDAENGPSGLTPTAVSSSNEGVVPLSSILFGGTGADRYVYISPAGTAGTSVVTIQVTDSDGNPTQKTFTVTVLPLDYAPAISTPPPTNTLVNTAVTVPFMVGDAETAATSLTVTAEVASYSGGILSGATVTLDPSDPSGTNRLVTVTPVDGATGLGIVKITVNDQYSPTPNTSTVSFAVMVLPNARTVFSEHFDYPLNTSILNSSPGFWTRRNANPQSVNFRTYSGDTQAWIRPKSGADDAAAPLAYGPYTAGNGTVLYLKLKAQWIDVGDVPVVGDSDGAFILLASTASATADQLVRIGTLTNSVPDGFFRLVLSNGGDTFTPCTLTDLVVGSVYSIVVRYDVDMAKSTLWVDAASEAAAGVLATDAQDPATVGSIAIRQELNMGNILVDDLTVLAITKPTLTSITPPSGGYVDIYFTGGPGDVGADFEVERATIVNGTYSTVAADFTALGGNTFKAKAPSLGEQSFYRVKRKPLTF